MSIILIKKKEVLAIPNLWRYVAKFIFDENNMSVQEILKMQESIVRWNEAIKLENEILARVQAADLKVFGRKTITDHKYTEEEKNLHIMANLLKENEENDPSIVSMKRTVKIHNLDYRKLPMFRFPEAYEENDFIKGQATLSQSKKDHPEDYE